MLAVFMHDAATSWLEGFGGLHPRVFRLAARAIKARVLLSLLIRGFASSDVFPAENGA